MEWTFCVVSQFVFFHINFKKAIWNKIDVSSNVQLKCPEERKYFLTLADKNKTFHMNSMSMNLFRKTNINVPCSQGNDLQGVRS